MPIVLIYFINILNMFSIRPMQMLPDLEPEVNKKRLESEENEKTGKNSKRMSIRIGSTTSLR